MTKMKCCEFNPSSIFILWCPDTQHNDTQHNDNQHKGLIYGTQHNNTAIMLSVVMLNVVVPIKYLCGHYHEICIFLNRTVSFKKIF
jgi:hypothetical protein